MKPRMVPFGFPVRQPRPRSETTRFVPGSTGWTELPALEAGAASIVSGHNLWARRGRLEPRSRLSTLGTGSGTSLGIPIGSFPYNDLDGTQYTVLCSQDTVAWFDGTSWSTLQYASNTSNHALSGSDSDRIFGTTVYLARTDENLAVFTNGADPLFCWAGPSDNTAYSTLTQSPIAADVCLFDNRLVAWNIQELSSSTRFVTRVQWCENGDPEDWTDTIAAGSEDLVDMSGVGTRIFAESDQMILATDQEIWRGRKVGLPYTFSFTPITREMGIPYAVAALQTPHGIFWLGEDAMVYRMTGEQATPIGEPIQRTLQDTMVSYNRAFFQYDHTRQQLTLYYAVAAAQYPTRAFTYHLDEGVWTPHTFSHQLTLPIEAYAISTSTTWGDLSSTVAAQTLTWAEFLGLSENPLFGVATSSGSVYQLSSTASLDGSSAVYGQIVTGNCLPTDPTTVKFVDDVRLDWRADSASSLSLSVSGDGGGTYPYTTKLAASVQSATTQTVTRPRVSGTHPVLMLESAQTGWSVAAVYLKAKVLGETL